MGDGSLRAAWATVIHASATTYPRVLDHIHLALVPHQAPAAPAPHRLLRQVPHRLLRQVVAALVAALVTVAAVVVLAVLSVLLWGYRFSLLP
jgi:hypothetical protein